MADLTDATFTRIDTDSTVPGNYTQYTYSQMCKVFTDVTMCQIANS